MLLVTQKPAIRRQYALFNAAFAVPLSVCARVLKHWYLLNALKQRYLLNAPNHWDILNALEQRYLLNTLSGISSACASIVYIFGKIKYKIFPETVWGGGIFGILWMKKDA